jgi:flagellar biosynthesis/type III secretory pathway protein FliH
MDAATVDSATVLRGQGHGGGRKTGPGGSTQAQIAAPIPVNPAGVDQFVLAEEAQRIQREAEQRGYEMGMTRAEAELRDAVAAASAMVEKIEAIAPERTSEIAHSIAELALSVAKRIIQHEVRLDPSLLCASLEAAVSTINGSPEAHVLLNPSAVEPVAEAWEALHGRAYLGKKWIFEGDPTLPVGGCTLRYEHGFVEAGLEAQLEEIGIALDRAIPGLARGTVDEEVA